jgi:putative DNA primase/helicase
MGIVNAPTLRPDCSIISDPGYDAATDLFFDPLGVDFPAIPSRPTREEALAALTLIENLIGTFPFVSA